MSNQVGDCFKFLWHFQNVQTLYASKIRAIWLIVLHSSQIQTMSRTVGSWLILSGVIWHITPNCDPRIDNDDIGVCFGCYGNIFIHTRVIGMY